MIGMKEKVKNSLANNKLNVAKMHGGQINCNGYSPLI